MVLKSIAAFGVLNFAAFLVLDIILGGDALSGKVEGGKYYLGNHGAYHQVSHNIIIYSACHAYSGLLGIAIAGLIAQHLKRRGG